MNPPLRLARAILYVDGRPVNFPVRGASVYWDGAWREMRPGQNMVAYRGSQKPIALEWEKTA